MAVILQGRTLLNFNTKRNVGCIAVLGDQRRLSYRYHHCVLSLPLVCSIVVFYRHHH